MSPDISKFTVCHPALDDNAFEPKLIEELAETTIRKKFKVEQDLVTYDMCKSSYGYDSACEIQSVTDRDGNEIHLLGSPNTMQGVLNMLVLPLINVVVPEHKAKLASGVFGRLFYLERLPEGPEKQHEIEKFLLDYGSHFHIGGSVQIGAVFECVILNQQYDEEDHEDMWSIIYDASKKNYQASKQKVWVKVKMIVDDEDVPKERLSEYKVRILSIGNLPINRDVDKWKREILQSTDHLPVIKRINSSVVGIWDLIKKEEVFTDSKSLAHQMKAVWEEIFKKRSPGSTDENHRQMELHRLLEMLNLQQYYPGKLSRQEALMLKPQNLKERQLTEESDVLAEDSMEEQYGGPLAMQDVAMSLIDKLIGIDYRCRNREIWRCSLSVPSRSNRPEDHFSASRVVLPHPQDVLLLAYQCCDPALQQLLASKMSICRLAIPFIIPREGDKLAVSLGPLHNITIEWAGASVKSFTKHPMHVISFIRIGKAHMSKSETINNILSSDTDTSSHDTFYHGQLWPSGMSPRTVANGVVEISHFIPLEGKKILRKEFILMNLRGDSSLYPNQRKVLGKLSSILVIFININDLTQQHFLDQLEDCRQSTKGQIILFLTCDRHNIPPKDLITEYTKRIDPAFYEYEPAFHYSEKGKNVKIESEIQFAQTALLNKHLWSSDIPVKSLEQHAADCACFQDVHVDAELGDYCKEAKEKVQQIVREMLVDTKIPNKKMLRLQGDLWTKWTKCLKFKHWSRTSETLHEINEIKEDMKKIRHDQFTLCEQMPQFFKIFIDTLHKTYETGHYEYQNFFYRLLMIEFDAISHKCLPELHQTVREKQQAVNNASPREDQRRLKGEASKAEEALYNASIGVEHFMRELAQVYECTHAEYITEVRIPQWASDLPKTAANLLLSGLPLEIMDGDTGFVPLTWVKQVFSSLEATLGTDKKLFVLSCIGIQSSGKSTLLNTMFGLEFAVGAGRASRGIFAHLLQVDKSQSNIPCDFVLVLDTEGLRAPERSSENISNDHELATLVVGLADLTLVNIKGENITEISEVLEMVVFAFLRIREADDTRKQKKQKCMFLHQNVTAVNAAEKMKNDHRLLRQTLDDRIKAVAAKGRYKIHQFSEIIQFDGKRHAWYFYDLLAGNPPMAPANPLYAEKARQLKQQIFKDATEGRTFADFCDNFEDLWKAMLDDDIVFSFRHSATVKSFLEINSLRWRQST